MTCLWNQSCLLLLLLTFSRGKRLDEEDLPNYKFDDGMRNFFGLNEYEHHRNCTRLREKHKPKGSKSEFRQEQLQQQEQQHPVLRVDDSVKREGKRSCLLPEAAFIFKQVILPESDVKTPTTACEEADMMDLLKFQGQKESHRPLSGLSEYDNTDDAAGDTRLIFKDTIGFEAPEMGRKGAVVRSFPKEKAPEIDSRARSRLAHDTKSNGAKIAFDEILTRVHTVEKLKGRARRGIQYRRIRATEEPKLEPSESSSEQNANVRQDREPSKRPKVKSARRSWKVKLWDNLRKSNVSSQTQRPSTRSSASPWKFLHMKSRYATRNVTVSSQRVNHLRRFLIKNPLKVSRAKANRPRVQCATKKVSAQKGHNCHYHYKNHRIREQQAFHSLKSRTKQTPGCTNRKTSTCQSLNEDAIMSTLGMDLSAPTVTAAKIYTMQTYSDLSAPTYTAPTTTAATTSTTQTYPDRADVQNRPTTSMEFTTNPRTTPTTLPSTTNTTATNTRTSATTETSTTTETPTTTGSPTTTETTKMTDFQTQHVETTAELTTYSTTLNMLVMTADEFTTGTTIRQSDIRDDDSATGEAPQSTSKYKWHRNRFRKS